MVRSSLIATGIPVDPVEFDGVEYHIGQGNNALLYPGLGLGTIVSGAKHVTDGMLLAAAEAVAGQVDVSERGAPLLPDVANLRASSATVAVAVAKAAAADGVATVEHDDLVQARSGRHVAAGLPGARLVSAEEHPQLRDVPIGLDAGGTRTEFDSMGQVEVPADRYWGAQTQRSLQHFSIGDDHMPAQVYHAYGHVKKAAATVNTAAGRLPGWKADAIIRAADETIRGDLDAHYPLYVWQTGSGTQSNMNVNEVISNRAIQLLGGKLGSQQPIGPNGDVNMGQSSNDTFPTAMHIAALDIVDDRVLPQLDQLASVIESKAEKWSDVVKIGRTHLEDAVPLTVGQEWSGWAAQLRACADELTHARSGLLELSIGGTAVGTGLNAPKGFTVDVARQIATSTGKPFVTAPNKFAAQGSLDAIVRAHAALRGLAVALMKIANDMRWLASGPRTGFAELRLPQNEPGSSIMPGKVNPTQCEAVVMISIQVLGNDTGVAFAGSQGNFELNAMRPIINAFLHSARILADGMESFRTYSVEGTDIDRDRVAKYVDESLMLVTALSPVIGYQNAAHIAEDALAKGQTLRDAALESGHVTAEQFDQVVKPGDMVGSGNAGA